MATRDYRHLSDIALDSQIKETGKIQYQAKLLRERLDIEKKRRAALKLVEFLPGDVVIFKGGPSNVPPLECIVLDYIRETRRVKIELTQVTYLEVDESFLKHK